MIQKTKMKRRFVKMRRVSAREVLKNTLIVIGYLAFVACAGLLAITSKHPVQFIPASKAAEIVPPEQVVPKNMVIAPDYVDEVQKDLDPTSPEDKLQYEPVTDEKPPLSNRSRKEEEVSGARYDDGAELLITPEPDFTVKDEKIEEFSEINTPTPASPQSPLQSQ